MSDQIASKKYRKKPVVIEAMRVDGISVEHVAEWCGGRFLSENVAPSGTVYGHVLAIPTLEGVMYADDGDYIIKGVSGEFYPCKPDIFAKTYEEVTNG